MPRPCVIFDIDGTLCDPSHRRHYLDNHDHDSFFAAMGDDPPKEAVITINKSASRTHTIILLSGRPEGYRGTTVEWLRKHDVRYSLLLMRANGDHRPDHIVKRQLLDDLLKAGYKPIAVFDDRPSVIKMWQEAGIQVLQVDPEAWNRSIYTPGSFHMTIGPSGAGKTTWLAGQNLYPEVIVSTDQFRIYLTGSVEDQSRNSQVWDAAHAVIRARVAYGLPTWLDATNLRNKDRKAVRDCLPANTPITYWVLNRPVAEKLETRGWRPESLIHKHEHIFNSNLKDILAGDNDSRVTVHDIRKDG